MSVEENKAIVHRFFDEIWNQGKEDVIQELVDNDWLPSDPALAHIRPRSGTSGISTFVRVYRSTFPDLKFTVKEMVADGDTVVTRFDVRGTHSGKEASVSFLGHRNFTIPPAGSTVEASGVSINRIVTSERSGAIVRKIKGNSWYWHDIGPLEALAVAQLRERARK
jgi:predicted ester cyclase